MKSKLSVTSIQEHTFLDSGLGPDVVVIDCGGCHGGFCSEVASRYGCLCHVLEPSPSNFVKIPKSPRIVKHRIALSNRVGVAEFNLADTPISNSLHALPEESVIGQIQVNTTSLDGFLAGENIRHVALLKLDIEGAEMEVLESISPDALAIIDQITVEFHKPFVYPRGADKKRLDSIVRRLGQAGFELVMPLKPIYFDTLFVKQSAFAMNWLDWCLLRLKHEQWSRLSRAAKRYLHF